MLSRNVVRQFPEVDTQRTGVVPCLPARKASVGTPEIVETQQVDHVTTSDVQLTALALVATSGFSPVTVVQSLSLELSNVCRAGVSWFLRVAESAPGSLLDHLWPGSSSATVAGRSLRVRSRLLRRRAITRVRLESNDKMVTFASWPSSMRRLEFGERFDRPVEGVVWPAGLEVVCFGNRFNQVTVWHVCGMRCCLASFYLRASGGIHTVYTDILRY